VISDHSYQTIPTFPEIPTVDKVASNFDNIPRT